MSRCEQHGLIQKFLKPNDFHNLTMPRFYDPQPLTDGEPVVLCDNASHHASRVLRMQPGDSLTVFDGEGGEWLARIQSIENKKVRILPVSWSPLNRSASVKVHLWLPLIKGTRMEVALEKATELGVTSIQLYTSERTEVTLKSPRLDKKIRQWQQCIIRACEQCGLNVPPPLYPLHALDGLWPEATAELKLIAGPGNTQPLAACLKKAENLVLLTGPEGGFSPAEVKQASVHGFQPCAFGERTLRAETAPAALLAAIQALYSSRFP